MESGRRGLGFTRPHVDSPKNSLENMSVAPCVGLIGCGRWGYHILTDLLALGSVVAVVDSNEQCRQRAALEGAEIVASSLDALPDIDGIVIATPPTTHAELIERVFDRTVPIFVEKPLTTDSYVARRLASLSQGNLFVMHKWRYHPGIERLAEVQRRGELGPVRGLRTVRLGWGRSHSDVDLTWTLVPHDLSIALEILGEVLVPRSAVSHSDGENVSALFAVLGNTPWHVLEVSNRHPVYQRRVQLHCRDGVAFLSDSYSAHVGVMHTSGTGMSMEPRIEYHPISTELPLRRELGAFLDHLRGGPPPKSSASESVTIIETIASLRELLGLDESRNANP